MQLSSGTELKAREVVLLNWFQGKDKATKHPAWARDIATKLADGSIKWKAEPHPLFANVNEQTL